MKFRNCEIQSVTSVTHDTKIFTLSLPPTCHISVPIGHHVAIKPNEPGMACYHSNYLLQSCLCLCTLVQVLTSCHYII